MSKETAEKQETAIHPKVEALRKQAISAHNWTSHDPEKRGAYLIKIYGQELTRDVELIKQHDGDVERYENKYVSMLSDWISAKSRCASSFVTGGSGFNTSRAEKANNSEHKKQGDFYAWRDKVLHAITKAESTNIVRGTEGALDKLKAKRDDLVDKNDRLKEINKLLRSKKLTLEQIKEKLKTDHGYTDEIIKDLYSYDFSGSCPKYWLHTAKINTLNKEIEGEEMRLAKYEDGNKEYVLNGVRVLENVDANRIQLFYDSKPDDDTRRHLKKHGMRWSPKNDCWQRQLTNNAIYSVKNYILKE